VQRVLVEQFVRGKGGGGGARPQVLAHIARRQRQPLVKSLVQTCAKRKQ